MSLKNLEVYIVYNTSFPMYLKAIHIPQQVSLYILYGAIVHKRSPRTEFLSDFFLPVWKTPMQMVRLYINFWNCFVNHVQKKDRYVFRNCSLWGYLDRGNH